MSEPEIIDLDDPTTPSALIAEAFRDAAEGPRSNFRAIHDYKLPAIVRGYLSIMQGNAVETENIEAAGFMPKLYGLYDGEPVRVTLVSSMGDVGISRKLDDRHDYFKRVSIYDLDVDNFTLSKEDAIDRGRVWQGSAWQASARHGAARQGVALAQGKASDLAPDTRPGAEVA